MCWLQVSGSLSCQQEYLLPLPSLKKSMSPRASGSGRMGDVAQATTDPL